MSSISFQNLVTRVSTENAIRRVALIDPNKFSKSVLQISDQQSRDKNYEKGIEYIRTYLASLQAKLNTLIEELNGLYELMLTDALYKVADTKDTAKLLNKLPNAVNTTATAACNPYLDVSNLDITPYNTYIRNNQYNPLFGSRSLDLSNYSDLTKTNNTSTARSYYVTGDQAHHELSSAFSTINYLWLWDLDRINSSYATTKDSYTDHSGILHVPEYHPAASSTTSGVTVDSDMNITGAENLSAADRLKYSEKLQANLTSLQPNRSVFFPKDELSLEDNTETLLRVTGEEYDPFAGWDLSYDHVNKGRPSMPAQYQGINQWGLDVAEDNTFSGTQNGHSFHFGNIRDVTYNEYYVQNTLDDRLDTNYGVHSTYRFDPILIDENFDGGMPAGWTQSGNNYWNVVNYGAAGFNDNIRDGSAPSRTSAQYGNTLFYGDSDGYGFAGNPTSGAGGSRLTSASFDLTGIDPADTEFYFKTSWYTETVDPFPGTGYDQKNIVISNNGTPVSTIDMNQGAGSGDDIAFGAWQIKTNSAPIPTGTNVQVGFGFANNDGLYNGSNSSAGAGRGPNNERGWNIDDVFLKTKAWSRGAMVTPPLDFTYLETAYLEFFDKSQTDQIKDLKQIYITTDPGASSDVNDLNNWTLIKDLTTDGDHTDWKKQLVELPCVAGKDNVRIKFIFNTQDGKNNNFKGWNLDDIRIFGGKPKRTDFYYYRQNIDQDFVSNPNAPYNMPELSTGYDTNMSRPNISFDTRRTNIDGKYNNTDGRTQIYNSDFPMFSNTVLSYVEQDPGIYNKEKRAANVSWAGIGDSYPVGVYKRNGTIDSYPGSPFFYDELGRAFTSDKLNLNGDLYLDDAASINLAGKITPLPSAKDIDTGDSGWVNLANSGAGWWFPHVAGTRFEQAGSYRNMAIWGKKTVYVNSPVTSNQTITVNSNNSSGYLYVNGKVVNNIDPITNKPIPVVNGTMTYSVPASYFSQGFNTVSFKAQTDSGAGSEGITISGSINGTNISTDNTWAVKVSPTGYGPTDDLRQSEIYDLNKTEVKQKHAFDLNFINQDSNGVGILSKIESIESVITGEPLVQTYVTTTYSTSTPSPDGALVTQLSSGFINGVRQTGTGQAINLGNTAVADLNYMTDIDGKALVNVFIENSENTTNDATVLFKVNYYDDEDRDGIIDSALKTKYIGLKDLRNNSALNVDSNNNATNNPAFAAAYSSVLDRYSMSGNEIYTDTEAATNAGVTHQLYDNYLAIGKGRSGGAESKTGNENKLTAKLKQIIDSSEWQEFLKFGLLDNIYLAASVSDNRGDQIIGKLILDWDWRRRRVEVKQGAFSSLFKA